MKKSLPRGKNYRFYITENTCKMIDREIIFGILHVDETDVSFQSGGMKKRKWVNDASFIFFQPGKQDDIEKVNALSAVQYLQRTRLLYSTLLRIN